MKNRCNNDMLKMLAQQAKQRLKGRVYDSDKKDSRKRVYESMRNNIRVLTNYNADYKLVIITNKEEERLYKKICDMLSSNQVSINPIADLIDREVYSQLDHIGKERYVLLLSKKFKNLKNRYEQELKQSV